TVSACKANLTKALPALESVKDSDPGISLQTRRYLSKYTGSRRNPGSHSKPYNADERSTSCIGT
ncbi:hypothetical protein V3C99_015213, partial [Haemonchus contortus]